MTWPTVSARIFPSHYQYIAFILSFVFPPEAALCITKNMKSFDEDENRKRYEKSYEYGHILHNLVKSPNQAIHYCRSSIKEIYRYREQLTTSKIMFIRHTVVNKIRGLGISANRIRNINNFVFWMGRAHVNRDNVNISKRMLDKIKKQNLENNVNEYMNPFDIINSNFNNIYIVRFKGIKYDDKRKYNDERKYNDNERNNEKHYIEKRKYNNPKNNSKIYKKTKHYTHKPMRYKMSRNRRCC